MEIFSNAGLALKNKSQVLVILVVETLRFIVQKGFASVLTMRKNGVLHKPGKKTITTTET